MANVTLDDRDSAVLERLCRGPADVETLAAAVDCDPDALRGRLPELADNDLVRRVEDRDGDDRGTADDSAATRPDRFAITDSGRRALGGTPAGLADETVDTPPEIDGRIDDFDLRADREAAVRNAYTFLRYWGDAYDGEVVDALYSERPAGYDSPAEWWTDLVADRLATLPEIEPPETRDPGNGSPGRWRYAGTPAIDADPEDGRVAPDDDAMDASSGRYAIESADLGDDDQLAARRAFASLVMAGRASDATLADRAVDDVGGESTAEGDGLDERIREVFQGLPDVELVGGSGGGQRGGSDAVWEYRPNATGAGSTDP